MHITLSRQARPSDDVLFQEIGGESVLLDLASERYFGLDSVGTRLWNLLEQDSRLQNAFDAMLVEYQVDPAVLETDILTVVRRMAAAGLVKIE